MHLACLILNVQIIDCSADHRLLREKMAGILATENNQSQIEDINKAKDLLHKDGKKVEAIELLVAVSKTGNKDATAMLTQCLDNGEGITNENRDIVEWCVMTPEVDKRLNHAMTELFMSLKKDGRENVTVQDIKDALNIAKEQVSFNSMPFLCMCTIHICT